MVFIKGLLMRSMKQAAWNKTRFPADATVMTESTYPTVDADGPMVKEYHRGLKVEQGATYTPSARCKGFMIAVKGNLEVDGTISMTARGASAPGDNLSLDYRTPAVLVNDQDFGSYEFEIGSTGGMGGVTSSSSGYASNGLIALNQACGGGGSGGGGASSAPDGGRGGAGTSYSGGAGGGGAYNIAGGAGSSTGGAGGAGRSNNSSRGAGGGAGNPRGASSYVTNTAESGTGGLLVIIVHGDVVIGETGLIQSDGSKGGNGEVYGGGGGGSGGGTVHILYTGEFINSGSVTANGGARGSSSVPGGNGGAGTIRVERISL